MRRPLIAALIAAAVGIPTISKGAPIEFKLNQQKRAYRNTGVVTLRDPFTDAILGAYRFVTGGFGRGSAPLGQYHVGTYRHGWDEDPSDDPLHIGHRWDIKVDGLDDGEVWDDRVHDTRTGIEIHGGHRMEGTLGCLGIDEPHERWLEFERNMRLIISEMDSPVPFDVVANPDGEPETAVAAYAPLEPVHHKAYARHHQAHTRHSAKQPHHRRRHR